MSNSDAEQRLLIERDALLSFNSGKGIEDNPFNSDSPLKAIWDECFNKIAKVIDLNPIQRQALYFRIQERARKLVEDKFNAGVPFLKDYDIGVKQCRYFNMEQKKILLENILIEGMTEGCKILQTLQNEIKPD
jgi:hypothetical protein